MEIDKEKIKQRISEISDALAEIRRLSALPDAEFWSKKENMAAVKYYLLQAIEAVGSICVHIAAKKFNKGVSAFGECFEVLEKEGLLAEDLAERLRKMVKFRNKLMHHYWEVDDENILQYARSELEDFNEFLKTIGKLF
ncbi:DUF86 domain-containing protein [Patescibacteria group bacterium]|nr:DUF86 domain-containing protein [Patescibacteria group bacterium]